ncbi:MULTISPECIES: hypothetical protein [Bacteroidales]|uniref:Uncharacterized protein n=1 Tax=Duncaniella dubosii TaxID=2518971 RepID=A0A4P7W4B1_9BACT|nr:MULTISPECIES: hypothetical protein [Bacteroidales]MCX4278688.1 hypothetical protein [Muribaculum sp.]QCD42873.1 hypothetical protein E7747_11610 [Duncaniella dubosii]
MKSKRRSKTMEQQARYYEVPDMEIYMYETYLNGNFSDLRRLYKELNRKGRRQFIGYVLTEVHEEDLKGILETIL